MITTDIVSCSMCVHCYNEPVQCCVNIVHIIRKHIVHQRTLKRYSIICYKFRTKWCTVKHATCIVVLRAFVLEYDITLWPEYNILKYVVVFTSVIGLRKQNQCTYVYNYEIIY